MIKLKNKEVAEFESRFKDVYQDGLKIFKEGLLGLELVANKTISVAKLKLETGNLEKKLENYYTTLGKIIFDQISDSKSKSISINPELKKTVLEIKSLKKNVEANSKKLAKTTAVNKISKKRVSKNKKSVQTKNKVPKKVKTPKK